ncbi:MAG TPA: hypothetical protein VLG46_15090, partial [Anaerolineae bacterium]|nr:hypothetical protein [Anaerolineae bacterium]
LIWVDVTPSTGAMVGCGGGGSGVSVTVWGGVTDNVAVLSKAGAVGAVTVRIWTSQPVLKTARMMKAMVESLMNTRRIVIENNYPSAVL